jgi:hypothetical protein
VKIKRERVTAAGKPEVVVELEVGEELIAIEKRGHYRLGGQIDDVVEWHVLTDSHKVHWCHFEQKWTTP